MARFSLPGLLTGFPELAPSSAGYPLCLVWEKAHWQDAHHWPHSPNLLAKLWFCGHGRYWKTIACVPYTSQKAAASVGEKSVRKTKHRAGSTHLDLCPVARIQSPFHPFPAWVIAQPQPRPAEPQEGTLTSGLAADFISVWG